MRRPAIFKSAIIVLVLATLAAVMSLSACTPGKGPTVTTKAPTEQTTAKTSGTTTEMISETSPEPFKAADLAAEINGKVYIMLGEAAELIESLGEPIHFSEAPSCLFEGTDKTYEYADLTLYTITQNGKELIDGIDLVTDKWQTTRGIKVGSTARDIIDTYGDAYSLEGDIVYVSDQNLGDLSPRVTFVMNDFKVTMISIYSGSNNQAE